MHCGDRCVGGGLTDINSLMFFFFQAEDGIRDYKVTGVQTCALPISTVAPFGANDGSFCWARLLLATDGTFYGTTANGGISNYGTVFRVSTNGILRSEEHTSELQSPCNLVCRLLLEKKKKTSCLHTVI